ncbi:MAG: hypothetical protein IJA69_00370 [Clostridia bacterium]|nr:hypothetical protein [Clostridia bacterium]
MEKSKAFSKELLEQLKLACSEEKLITIKGVNSFGQEFETTGRITHTDKGSAGVSEDVIWLEFGKSKDDEDRKQTKWFAPYRLTYDSEGFGCSALYVFSIEIDGKVVFENENKQTLIEHCEKDYAKEQEELKKDGRNVLPKGKFMQDFLAQIGKPITIGGTDCVLAGVSRVNMYGNPIVDVIAGPLVGGLSLTGTRQVITTETNDGKTEVVAEMDKEYIREIIAIQEKMGESQEI